MDIIIIHGVWCAHFRRYHWQWGLIYYWQILLMWGLTCWLFTDIIDICEWDMPSNIGQSESNTTQWNSSWCHWLGWLWLAVIIHCKMCQRQLSRQDCECCGGTAVCRHQETTQSLPLWSVLPADSQSTVVGILSVTQFRRTGNVLYYTQLSNDRINVINWQVLEL